MKRVLVIDDDEAIRKVFLLALEGTVQVDTCHSGKLAIALAEDQKYDLIYIDLKMPEINGVETLRRLRGSGIQVPVYLMTAYYGDFQEELRRAQEQGLEFELLKKPLMSSQLVSITRGILEGAAEY